MKDRYYHIIAAVMILAVISAVVVFPYQIAACVLGFSLLLLGGILLAYFWLIAIMLGDFIKAIVEAMFEKEKEQK